MRKRILFYLCLAFIVFVMIGCGKRQEKHTVLAKEYYADGMLKKEYNYSDKWILESSREYAYYDDYQTITDSYYDENGKINRITRFTYDLDDRMLHKQTEVWKNNSIDIYDDVYYSYNENGLLTHVYYYVDAYESVDVHKEYLYNGRNELHTINTYDSKGNLINQELQTKFHDLNPRGDY